MDDSIIDRGFLRPLSKAGTSDYRVWFEDRSDRLWGQVQSLVRSKGSASVLIFGPRGTGRTSFAVEIAQRAIADLPGLRHFFVDCGSLSIIPDITDRKLLDEKVRALSGQPKGGWLLLLEELDALKRDRTLSELSASIWARIRSIWLSTDFSYNRIVLATAQDPSTIDPTLLERINLMHYLAPVPSKDLRSLVSTVVSPSASIPQARIDTIAGEVAKLLSGAHVQRVAPNAFLRAFWEGVGQPGAARMTPAAVAKHVCAAGSAAFFDSATVAKYERENQPFIVQSKFLDSVSSSA